MIFWLPTKDETLESSVWNLFRATYFLIGLLTIIVLHIYSSEGLIKRSSFCLGVICGNTYVIKPSERDPTACMALVELFKEAGCPDGVVNVIHGQHETVNFICDHPDIR